jgi:hypothetical protein
MIELVTVVSTAPETFMPESASRTIYTYFIEAIFRRKYSGFHAENSQIVESVNNLNSRGIGFDNDGLLE